MIINRVDFNRKVLAMLLICTLITSSLFPTRTHAFAPAIPIAAVGTVVLTVAGIAVIANELGYTTFSDEAWDYSDAIWKGATQAVKDSLSASYSAALSAGSGMMSLSKEVMDYLKQSMGYFAASSLSFYEVQSGTNKMDYQSGAIGSTIKFYNTGTTQTYIANTYYGLKELSDFRAFLANPGYDSYVTGYYGSNSIVSEKLNPFVGESHKNLSISQVFEIAHKAFGFRMILKSDLANVLSKSDAMKASVPLAIPTPMAKDFIVVGADDTQVVKTPLVLQPDSTWKNAETGKVYNPADIKVQTYPKVKVQTDAKTGTKVTTIAQDGVDVNVRTGEKVGDVTANPPLDLNPPSGSINWGPLKAVGSLFTTKFPFSIPWDIARQLSIFNVKPQTPVFDVDIAKFFDYGGTKFGMKFHVDLSAFDTIAVIARWASTIVFDIGLILSIRKFMPE